MIYKSRWLCQLWLDLVAKHERWGVDGWESKYGWSRDVSKKALFCALGGAYETDGDNVIDLVSQRGRDKQTINAAYHGSGLLCTIYRRHFIRVGIVEMRRCSSAQPQR